MYTSPRPVRFVRLVRVVKQWFTVVQLVNCISLERLRVSIQVHDPYDSFDSYGSWNNGLQVVQLVNCISLERLRVSIQVHDPYDSFDSYGSWNNGLQVVQLVNCISLERLESLYTSPRPVRLVRLVRVVKQWFTGRTVGELHIIRET